MATYTILADNGGTVAFDGISLAHAATFSNLDPNEITAMIEEYGQCDFESPALMNRNYTIVEAGERYGWDEIAMEGISIVGSGNNMPGWTAKSVHGGVIMYLSERGHRALECRANGIDAADRMIQNAVESAWYESHGEITDEGE